VHQHLARRAQFLTEYVLGVAIGAPPAELGARLALRRRGDDNSHDSASSWSTKVSRSVSRPARQLVTLDLG
jgi:hypothetical protein